MTRWRLKFARISGSSNHHGKVTQSAFGWVRPPLRSTWQIVPLGRDYQTYAPANGRRSVWGRRLFVYRADASYWGFEAYLFRRLPE